MSDNPSMAIDLHALRDEATNLRHTQETQAEQIAGIRSDVTALREEVAELRGAMNTQHAALMAALSSQATEAEARAARWAVIVDRLTQREVIFAFLAIVLIVIAAMTGMSVNGYGVSVRGPDATIEPARTDAVSESIP